MGPYQALEALKERLIQHQEEHRKLDEMIAAYTQRPGADQLSLGRLKKRKLALKDEIAYLISALQPNIIA